MYEIIYHYYERNQDGPGYDVTHPVQMKRKVGTLDEETPAEKLAGSIIAQLARRDVMISDVEVYEFTRKRVAFKETKGGIVVGNRKYSFDQCDLGFSEDTPAELALPAPSKPTPAPQSAPLPQVDTAAARGGNVGDLLYFQKNRPIREEMFAPKDKALVAIAKSRKLPFTVGKVYQIYEEKPAAGGVHAGMSYTVKDDTGNRYVLSDKYFDMVPRLFGGDAFNEDAFTLQGPTDPVEMDMPDVTQYR